MAEDSPVESRPGEEAYTRIKTLGRGAFGEAVLYRKTEDNMLVVCKEVNLSRASDKERSDAEKEVEILSLLNHTNIVTYFNHYIDGNSLFIEMEYCNGGTLNDKICSQKELFPEEIVVWYFFQICAGMAHVHEFGVVHRDIKTLNIFLTKSGLVKLGDFGIATVLRNSQQMAESVVGTPYYMSPEIVQGKKYNQKSDIWAVGCVLYEMLTLRKVFDATNPLKLVSNIVKGDFEDIDPQYTNDMRDLVTLLLSQNPVDRPTIQQILDLPILAVLGSEMGKKVWELNASTRRARLSNSASTDTVPVITSKSSEVYFWGGGKQTPQKVDCFVGGTTAAQVSAGHSHFAVVTVEMELFTWANVHSGKNMVGQLGHGDTASYRIPKTVRELHGIPVRKVACGDEFTACLTEEGQLYTFGSDYWGCIGCDNSLDEEVKLPYRVEFFSDHPVDQLACGECHVVVLTASKEVYAWGCGEYGRLGLGSEDDYASPQKVALPTQCNVVDVVCGTDFTFVLTGYGRLMAFGNNEDNQMGLNTPRGLRKRLASSDGTVLSANTPKHVMSVNRFSVAYVAAGRSHSAFIDVYGRLITVGSNKFGQLGLNDFKKHPGPVVVGGELLSKQVTSVACGDDFTVATTTDNLIYTWGRGDNGRLGIFTDSLSRSKAGVPCTSMPRPMFGSLQLVSNLSCSHWNAIIVAERVLSSRALRRSAAVRSQDSQSSQGDNAGSDSVFTDRPMRLNIGLSDEDSQDNLFANTSDSGVGPSPREPGRGGLEDSDPPPWLRDELDQAEQIPAGGSAPGSGPPPRAASADSSVPAWLENELKDAEFIPMEENQAISPATGRDVRMTSQAVQCNLGGSDAVSEVLLAKVRRLEEENDQLKRIIADKSRNMGCLEQENAKLVENQKRFWRLIDSWHKDCQAGANAAPTLQKKLQAVPTRDNMESMTQMGNRGVSQVGNPTPAPISSDDACDV